MLKHSPGHGTKRPNHESANHAPGHGYRQTKARISLPKASAEVIDFLRLGYSGSAVKDLLRRKEIPFKEIVCRHTKTQAGAYSKADFHGLKLKVWGESRLEVRGSLHHFRSVVEGMGKTNADRFTYAQLCAAIELLSDALRIPASSLEVHGLEFGLNLDSPPFPVREMVDSFVTLGKDPFERWEKKAIGRTARRSQYELKVYDKQAQGHARNATLRLEIKVKKMQCIKPIAVHNLADLKDPAKLERLFKWMRKHLDSAFVFEPAIKQKQLSKTEWGIWNETRYPDYWEKLTAKKRAYRHKQAKEIIARICPEPRLKTVLQLLDNEFRQAMNLGDSYHFSPTAQALILGDSYRVDQSAQKSKLGDSYPLDEGEENTTEQRASSKDSPRNDPAGLEKAARTCAVCSASIDHLSIRAKYCDNGRKCRDEAHNQRRKAQFLAD